MDALYSFLALVTGLILRLGVPILVTVAIVYALHRLDARWQAEAELKARKPPVEKEECWEIKNCPQDRMVNCIAFGSPEPCWQVHRLHNGYLREECLTCVVFRSAPTPAHLHA